jgi:hypothetical protein
LLPEAKIEMEGKKFSRLEVKKSKLSLVSHMTRISTNLKRKRMGNKRNEAKQSKRNENEPKNCFTRKISESEIEREISEMKRQNRCETKKNRKIV